MSFTTALRFTLNTQKLHNWCWVAVHQGVRQYLTHGRKFRQCEVASAFFNDECCVELAIFDKPQILGGSVAKGATRFEMSG